ncbi:hypothetical protein EVAR_23891_1 [Eumeta japonica]|uniref:Uncharacterized protein n=1 Tax=Eumeta variegata TaxID=151549 RepID=A0A4C1V3V6_EUMVA|nr:hypothetical protein EVAR_23891_1 [Eumeta japonica]
MARRGAAPVMDEVSSAVLAELPRHFVSYTSGARRKQTADSFDRARLRAEYFIRLAFNSEPYNTSDCDSRPHTRFRRHSHSQLRPRSSGVASASFKIYTFTCNTPPDHDSRVKFRVAARMRACFVFYCVCGLALLPV